MARRKRGSKGPQLEDFIKLGLVILALISLGIGGVTHFIPVLLSLVLMLVGGLLLVGTARLAWLWWRSNQRRPGITAPLNHFSPAVSDAAVTTWTISQISDAFEKLDWYQFEKVNAAILQLEGWSVQRRGGAAPDGGVDLIAERSGEKKLIQCKHWLTWKVQEKVVRELLGSMTHMNVSRAALHTIGGYTAPAVALAAQHGIELSDRAELAQRVRSVFSDADIEHWLREAPRCCPKCDSPMVLRTGSFDPFWGCSKFPRCRGKINARVEAVAQP